MSRSNSGCRDFFEDCFAGFQVLNYLVQFSFTLSIMTIFLQGYGLFSNSFLPSPLQKEIT